MNDIIMADTLQIIMDNDMSKLKNSTFLITGASGMVGKYLVNVLLTLNEKYNMNIKIIALVRNISKLEDYIINNMNVKIINQDVINPINVTEDIDYIINTASPASPIIMKDKPFETNIANTVGTYQTIKLAIKKKCKCYVYISSREIYGQPAEGQTQFYENGPLGQVDPLIPRNGYAEGKKAAENMCVSAHDEYKLNTKIIRLAHTYGPGMSINDGRVQADFLRNIIRKENIIMKSDGSSVRTYTYIADAVNAIFKVLLNGKDIVYNVSNIKDKTTIKDLALLLIKISGEDIKLIVNIENNQKGTASFTNGILNSDKIIKELNWKPLYSMENGFKRTIEYLKSIEGVQNNG